MHWVKSSQPVDDVVVVKKVHQQALFVAATALNFKRLRAQFYKSYRLRTRIRRGSDATHMVAGRAPGSQSLAEGAIPR